jgi:hypothetical protein
MPTLQIPDRLVVGPDKTIMESAFEIERGRELYSTPCQSLACQYKPQKDKA